MLYNKVPTDLKFVEREKEVEKFWKDNDIFQKSIEDHEGHPRHQQGAGTERTGPGDDLRAVQGRRVPDSRHPVRQEVPEARRRTGLMPA